MFGKNVSNQEREQFLSIALPGKKDISQGEEGRILYSLKRGRVTDGDLRDLFPEDYQEFKDFKKEQAKVLGFLDKTNYVQKYFFKVYNPKKVFKVKPAKVIGFKAERKGGKNIMKVKVKYPNGEVEEKSLELFAGIKISPNLNDYVLVHRTKVCQKITREEYEEIVNNY